VFFGERGILLEWPISSMLSVFFSLERRFSLSFCQGRCNHEPIEKWPVLAPFLIGWRKSGCAKEAPFGGRGYPGRASTNREAKSCPGVASLRKRRGRICALRAKPAGIGAQASKKKRGDREVESAITA